MGHAIAAARAVRGAPDNGHRRSADGDHPSVLGIEAPTNRSVFPIRDGNHHVIASARRKPCRPADRGQPARSRYLRGRKLAAQCRAEGM